MKKLTSLFILLFTLTLSLSSVKAYTDVPVESWFYPYVVQLQNQGIVDSADKFRPADPLQRAELVKMVILAIKENGKEALPQYPAFDDVPLNTWFAPFVERAATLGIVNGYMNDKGDLTGFFGPADPVTRAQAMKILVEAFDLKATTTGITFGDVKASDWFYSYVSIGSALGIIQGYEGNIFKPNEPVTRSEMAKMLSLAMAPSNPTLPPLDEEGETPENETPGDENEEDETPGEEGDEDGEDEENEENEDEGDDFESNNSTITDSILTPSDEELVARYSFKGQLEDYLVSTLTIVNDEVGNDFGDDVTGDLVSIKNVILKYPDEDGNLKEVSQPLSSNGTAKFSNLDFYVKRQENTPLEIYVDMSGYNSVSEEASGENFRLGVKNVSNDLNSFKAVGEFSSEAVTLGEAIVVTNSDTAHFTVRNSVPKFELVTKEATLNSGTNKLIGLKVTADEAGPVSIARLVFDLSIQDENNADLELSDFEWMDGSDVIDANIFEATEGLDLTDGNSLLAGQYKVIVSFDEEQIIGEGESKIYYLRAEAKNANTDDTITTELAAGDENSILEELSELQENTGKIFFANDPTIGIFTETNKDFSELVGTFQNIIWSDFSAGTHNYPDIENGMVENNSGSADWTNGYQLGVNGLESSVLN